MSCLNIISLIFLKVEKAKSSKAEAEKEEVTSEL